MKENLNREIKRIFLLGPSHHVHLNKCSLSGCEELETPIGNLKVDTAVIAELLNTGYFERTFLGVEESEHSIEMHLPYIARVMSGNSKFQVVPIMVDALDNDQLNIIANQLVKYLGEKYPTRENVKRLTTKFNPKKIMETLQKYERQMAEIRFPKSQIYCPL